MPSKLMKRKIAWARAYAAKSDVQIKILRDAQRKVFRRESSEDPRQLALARTVIEADRRFQVIGIKDGRNPGNKRQEQEAYKRLERAHAQYARHRGRKPDAYGDYWGWHAANWTEIGLLVMRLRTATEEET
jgi:hypothetical protein